MNLKQLNEIFEWRGIKTVPTEKAFLHYDTKLKDPISIRIEYKYPDAVPIALSNQYQTVLERDDRVKSSFILMIDREFDDALEGILVPLSWLEDRRKRWSSLSRYLTFMLFPYEEETRPTDALASSYQAVQRDILFVDAEEEIREFSVYFEKFMSSLKSDQFLVDSHVVNTLLSKWAGLDALDGLIRHCIKTMPEYTGSQLEEQGEALWKDSVHMKKRLV